MKQHFREIVQPCRIYGIIFVSYEISIKYNFN